MIKQFSLMIFIFAVSCQNVVWGAVSVDNRTGNVRITNAVVASVNDKMKNIPDGSKVEVLDGAAQVSTTAASTAKIGTSGLTFQVGSLTQAKVTCESPTASLVEITAGRMTWTTDNGGTAIIGPGAKVRVGASVTWPHGIEVLEGEVLCIDVDGKSHILKPKKDPDISMIDNDVENEEAITGDISPICDDSHDDGPGKGHDIHGKGRGLGHCKH